MFSVLLQKDLLKRKSRSLTEGFFKHNYCHPCHRRFCRRFFSPVLLRKCRLLLSTRLPDRQPDLPVSEENRPFHCFFFSSTFDIDKVEKIRQWKERHKINKIAKLESDL